ncbi:GFA family protein [Chitinimonas naiadis]
MTEIFEGQCQCGEVQYRVTGAAATLFACHCTECQRQSASAFGMALWVRNAKVELVSGVLHEWVRHTPAGKEMACSFCPTCGTRVFHKMRGQTELLSIKPGTLNDTKALVPVGHIWTASKQPWVHIPTSVLQYDGNPSGYEALFSAWRAAHP